MFKIGEFSKLSHVTVKTLRYYDKIGLLKPSKVDRFTSYRYYSASQLGRLNRILALKDLGLALDEIARLLDHDLPPEQIRGMLRLKQVELQEQLEEEQARLARVEQRLRQIEQEENMSEQEVALKEVPARPVASVRDVIPTFSQLDQLFGEIFAYVGHHRVSPSGPPITLYHDEAFQEQDVDVEVTVPVTEPLPDGERVKFRQLPAAKMACIVHQGSYETIGGTYGRVMEWIEANDCRVAGPPHEIYVQGPEADEDPSTFITEIQIPVEKA